MTFNKTGKQPRKSSTKKVSLSNTNRMTTSKRTTLKRRVNYTAILRNLGEDYHTKVLEQLEQLRLKYPNCPRVNKWLTKHHQRLNRMVVGDSTLSDDVTTLSEAPFDLPPVPYNNSTLLERKCRVQKLANQGTVGGGLSAYLTVGDLATYTGGTNGPFRVKEVTSWTIPRYNSGASAAEFSSVNVPLQSGSTGTEVMPTWASNFTRVGEGFSGLVTKFPLGDLPLFSAPEGSLNILQHFVGDGFTGGSATDFLSVVFDVVIECLI